MSRQVLHVIAITEILAISAKQETNASQVIEIFYDGTRFKICERLRKIVLIAGPISYSLNTVLSSYSSFFAFLAKQTKP